MQWSVPVSMRALHAAGCWLCTSQTADLKMLHTPMLQQRDARARGTAALNAGQAYGWPLLALRPCSRLTWGACRRPPALWAGDIGGLEIEHTINDLEEKVVAVAVHLSCRQHHLLQ